ncbi:dihydroxyacetone kinase subunit DhaL [Clavibacter sepedonicus]|uniref:Dihydroxyacetone kinase subunit n=1 Tax=Clavibacter sepedonicus TaxID=31964 RepID=B0REA6_CLASE|nr:MULTISPECIES: dihydroxyacetone kinase subunit DhaL [Clavibacter]MBD5383163.1 dihydroxyacetone kinase subunit L [Clavibacter sp.]OQJ49195.1 dihydroxyacetone kinase subunit L [Clavibacter sepedonicus]OQJ54807.1 dihydroxyacetone kinase subunit L [Clavibacter sepedonicus]UUK64966.1 dihydroxyacetone kinase subunit L [Clavibacter sepedonicus]CAQ00824.1 putative dihydroxyacetone kinase subunit [Clavibacter sepedonicus]
MALGTDWVVAWITEAARVIADQRGALIALDREIGDGDHGENLDRGFGAVTAKLAGLASDAAPADALKAVATTLISTVGGASGPLLGTAYLKAAAAVSGRADLDASAITDLLEAAVGGIVLRGKAERGDKTMVDAWAPAAEAARAAADAGSAPADALAAAADAAARGAEETEPLVARKGRASYLGDRAIGHRDPGAQSSALILRAAATTAADADGGAS